MLNSPEDIVKLALDYELLKKAEERNKNIKDGYVLAIDPLLQGALPTNDRDINCWNVLMEPKDD